MPKILSFFLLFALSCTDNSPVTNNGIVGKWQLTETCLSPGTGGCTWAAVQGADAQIIELTANGQALGYLACNGKYVFANEKITFEIPCNSSPLIWIVNQISTTSLTIQQFGCREACLYKFKAVK
jgi:hypothetical protein